MPSFDTRFTNVPASLWQQIARIDEIKGEWRYGTGLGSHRLRRLRRSELVASTGASTRIGCIRLSDDEVERLMYGLSVQQLTDREVQEVRGYYNVLQLVFESSDSIELSETTIKRLHGQLHAHPIKDERNRGQDKSMDTSVQAADRQGQVVRVPLATAPPSALAAKQMSELVDWTNQALAGGQHHALLVIANFIIEFLKIQPLHDGTGRLSRILTDLLLLRAGYGFVPYVSHERLIEANKIDYYMALWRCQATFGTSEETIEPWLACFLDVCLRQARQSTGLLSGEAIGRLLSPSQHSVWDYLLGVNEAAPRQITAATGVPLPTVAQALDRLLKLGKVQRLGRGRATRYRQVSGGDVTRTAA